MTENKEIELNNLKLKLIQPNQEETSEESLIEYIHLIIKIPRNLHFLLKELTQFQLKDIHLLPKVNQESR